MPGGTGTRCTRMSPCATLQPAVDQQVPVIKIGAGTIGDDKVTIIDGREVTIVGEAGAKLTRTNFAGAILEARNAAKVHIYDIELTGATGVNDGDAILAQAGGLAALTLDRVVVSRNARHGLFVMYGDVTIRRSVFYFNYGGAIFYQGGDFEMTNNIFVLNGSPSSRFGALSLSPLSGTHHIFEFNTIANNIAGAPYPDASQLECTLQLRLNNNILIGTVPPICVFDYTLFQSGTTVTGNNRAGNPMFLETIDVTSGRFFRIGSNSAAIDGAESAGRVDVTADIDGDARPQGNGKDMGADEARP